MDPNEFATIRVALEKQRDELTHQLEELGRRPDPLRVVLDVRQGTQLVVVR